VPQIIVTADHGASLGEAAVMFRERVNVADFESEHFATQLVERIGWAVGDADQVERVAPALEDRAEGERRRRERRRTLPAAETPAETAAESDVERVPSPI
jgi:hypothetical protein